MINRKFFFDHVRVMLFGRNLNSSQVRGLTAILDEWETGNWGKDTRHLAYMLATAHHETDSTMQAIEEYGKGKDRPYGRRLRMDRKPYSDTNNIFYGRGLVQLTWYENYELAGKMLGVDLINYPKKACVLPIAVKIMFNGMRDGWFTGKSLSNYFSGDREDWVNARRIINGTDKANLIAGYGKKYYAAISLLPV